MSGKPPGTADPSATLEWAREMPGGGPTSHSNRCQPGWVDR
jgi:hypothetical protein